MSLVEVGFEVHRGLIAESAVEPLAVVEDFQPLEDGRLGLGAGGELAAMHQLALQAAPEAFHDGVVVAVASAAHAGLDAGSGEPLPIRLAGVLATAIGVMDQPAGGGWRWVKAMSNAASGKLVASVSLMAQPTQRRL